MRQVLRQQVVLLFAELCRHSCTIRMTQTTEDADLPTKEHDSVPIETTKDVNDE